MKYRLRLDAVLIEVQCRVREDSLDTGQQEQGQLVRIASNNFTGDLSFAQ